MIEDDDTKPTMAERYGRAATSSHLRLKETRCDVDYLIAAGWLQDGLGSMLYRLRSEFDQVRGQLRAAETSRPEWKALALAAEQVIKGYGSPVPASVLDEPARIRKEARDAALVERAMVLVKLKTLAPAREALGAFAVILATKIMFMQDDAAVGVLVCRTLDAWLDPICAACDGRGFNGGSHRGELTTRCRECRGTGKRRSGVGMDSEERRFVTALLAEIDQHQAFIDLQMQRFLASQQPAGAPSEASAEDAAATLKQRLVELRSAQAEMD